MNESISLENGEFESLTTGVFQAEISYTRHFSWTLDLSVQFLNPEIFLLRLNIASGPRSQSTTPITSCKRPRITYHATQTVPIPTWCRCRHSSDFAVFQNDRPFKRRCHSLGKEGVYPSRVAQPSADLLPGNWPANDSRKSHPLTMVTPSQSEHEVAWRCNLCYRARRRHGERDGGSTRCRPRGRRSENDPGFSSAARVPGPIFGRQVCLSYSLSWLNDHCGLDGLPRKQLSRLTAIEGYSCGISRFLAQRI